MPSRSYYEIYLQILAPAYRISVGFQKTSSTIADIIPSILALKNNWRRMDLEGDHKRLCRLLVLSLENKFKSEVKSDILMVLKEFMTIKCLVF